MAMFETTPTCQSRLAFRRAHAARSAVFRALVAALFGRG